MAITEKPILTQIEIKMKSLVEGMLQSNSYNYNWGTVNERDVANSKFPSAIITLNPDEINLDDDNGVWAQAYNNKANFLITVQGELTVEEDNPVFAINEILTRALDDLKKLFGTNNSIDGLADKIMYESSTRIEKKNGDIMLPSILETQWGVWYTQDRQFPRTPDP